MWSSCGGGGAYARCRSRRSTPGRSASCGRCAIPQRRVSLRSTTDTSSDSDVRLQPPPVPASPDGAPGAAPVLPRRWTLHGLNNGTIFRATCYGVQRLPRSVSYAIGHVGTYIAWRTMAGTRRAVADNLAAVFPDESPHCLERRALDTLRSYAADVIDFLRALARPPEEAADLFDSTRRSSRCSALTPTVRHAARHRPLRQLGSAACCPAAPAAAAHHLAIAEADPQVNEIRHILRRRSAPRRSKSASPLDTALQIRRRSPPTRSSRCCRSPLCRDRVPVTMFGRRAWFLRTPLLLAHPRRAAGPCFVERSALDVSGQARTRGLRAARSPREKRSRPRRSRSPMRCRRVRQRPDSGITSTATGRPARFLRRAR